MDPFDLRLWEGFKAAGGDISKPAIIDQVTIDSRRIDSKNSLFVALEGKNEDGHLYIPHAATNGASYIIAKKNSISNFRIENAKLLLVDSPLHSLQQIAKTYRKQMPCKVIAIAGSHGKTMVKDLLFQMIETEKKTALSPESFNSQIGVALSLLTIRKSHDVAIIEAAISEKNEMALLSDMIDADFTIVTHIGKKHLSTLRNLQTIADETLEILKPLSNKENSWALLPEDPHLQQTLIDINKNFYSTSLNYWTNKTKDLPHAIFTTNERRTLMPYRVEFPNGYSYEGQTASGFYYFLDLINITTKGAWLLKVSSENIAKVLSNYHISPVRTEIWTSPIGTIFINETYCSDPQSIESSMKHFSQADRRINHENRKIFLFGGMRGSRQHIDSDYKSIANTICKNHIHKLILFGPHEFKSLIKQIETIQKENNISIDIHTCQSFEEALNLLAKDINPKDIVLIKGDNKFPSEMITETFNDSVSTNQCLINLAAIGENIQAIRAKIPSNTRIMVIVKALAYGTDEIRMAKFLETCGVDILGVSYVDEGVALKRAFVSQDIFVINAAPYEASKIVKWDLSVGVSDRALIESINEKAFAANKKIKVHLHVDTGMNRFGCRVEEALSLAKLIMNSKNLILEGIMTHFAAADDPLQDEFTLNQAESLQKVIDLLATNGITAPWKHAANSAGTLRFNFPGFNMVRIGLAVYGLHSSKATKETLDLRLSLSLMTKIVGINICKKGETISYNRSYKVDKEEQKIAVLPIGYFDGLHRSYSDKGIVNIRGQKAPMVGKICMDFMMVDVTNIDNVSTGDPVLVFGEDEHGAYLSPEELAASGSSIVHELITCLGPRIERIFIYEEAHRSY